MIIISSLQKKNPIISYLTKTIWYLDSDLTCDFEVNGSICVIFLSLRYHIAKPEYVLKRIKNVRKDYRLKILLIQADIFNYNMALKDLYSIDDFVIILTKNFEESSEYLLGFHSAKDRSVNNQKKKNLAADTFLLDIPKITKVELGKIKTKYKNIQGLCSTSEKDLENTFGGSKIKASSIFDIINKPFKK